MNKNQRLLGRFHQARYNDHERKDKQERFERHDRNYNNEIVNRHEKANNGYDGIDPVERNKSTAVDEFLLPKITRMPLGNDRFTRSKSCYVKPKQNNFGQLTEVENSLTSCDENQNKPKKHIDFDPLMSETVNQLKELRKVLCDTVAKVENSSQCTSDKKLSVPEFGETPIDTIGNVDELDKYPSREKDQSDPPENINISDIPRVKIIAKKYSRFNKNNVELRKLDEKVVCVEYDVFLGQSKKPREKLRAFFSVKPKDRNTREGQMNQILSKIKKTYNISDKDLQKLNDKEVEIIDDKITENKIYLDDLKRILRKKAKYARKKGESLDLMSLYEMAKTENSFYNQFQSNFITKAELQEINHLIQDKSVSSTTGINRRTVKEAGVKEIDAGAISRSIIAELLRESGTKGNK